MFCVCYLSLEIQRRHTIKSEKTLKKFKIKPRYENSPIFKKYDFFSKKMGPKSLPPKMTKNDLNQAMGIILLKIAYNKVYPPQNNRNGQKRDYRDYFVKK